MGVMLAAAGWGFAEATLFFVVPDVLLSFVTLKSLRRALVACLLATGGALLGGCAMYAWGRHDPAGALAVLDALPAISPAMLDRVERDLGAGLGALMTGPFLGTPYKIYAVQAAALGIGLAPFLLVSVPARSIRFVLVSLLVAWIAGRLPRGWTDARRRTILTMFWVVFYGAFFSLMAN